MRKVLLLPKPAQNAPRNVQEWELSAGQDDRNRVGTQM